MNSPVRFEDMEQRMLLAADLIGQMMQISPSDEPDIGWGNSETVTCQVLNQGPDATAGPFTQSFWLSSDRLLDPVEDIFLGTYVYQGTIEGNSSSSQFQVDLQMPPFPGPDFMGIGPFVLIMQTDSMDEVVEENEDNNASTAGPKKDYDSFFVSVPDAGSAGGVYYEGSYGLHRIDFTVSLDSSWTDFVTVDFWLQDGTAVAGEDYVYQEGTLVFQPGETSKIISTWIIGDDIPEPDEEFSIEITNPSNAVISNALSKCTIRDDDSSLSISDSWTIEGDDGSSFMVFDVHLSSPPESTVTVDYATGDGTALGGGDYEAVTGTLTFDSGDDYQRIVMPILPDRSVEGDETFTVTLSNPVGAIIDDSKSTATGTILDDDAGAVPLAAGRLLTVTDWDGDVATVRLAGPGAGEVHAPTAGDPGRGLHVQVWGTSAASSLHVNVRRSRGGDGKVALEGLRIDGPIGTVQAPLANATGTVELAGPARRLALGNLNNAHLLINSAAAPAGRLQTMVTMGTAEDVDLTSNQAIRLLRASAWTSTGAGETITAPAMGTLQIAGGVGPNRMRMAGDLEADVLLNGPVAAGQYSLMQLFVAGAMRSSDIDAYGSIGSAVVGAMSNSSICAGMKEGIEGLPAREDFARPAAIGSLVVTGSAQEDGHSVLSSIISAKNMGVVVLRNVKLTSGGEPWGVSGSVSRLSLIQKGRWFNRAALPQDSDFRVVQ